MSTRTTPTQHFVVPIDDAQDELGFGERLLVTAFFLLDSILSAMQTGITALQAPFIGSGNKVLATPADGTSGASTYRALVADDLPAPAVEAKNLVYAGPVTGSDAAPTFRALAADDLPAAILPAASGAPSDTPALGTVRFDPSTGVLYVYGSSGWVYTTLTSGS